MSARELEGASAELAADLFAVRNHLPAYDVHAGEARLLAALAAGGGLGVAAGAASAPVLSAAKTSVAPWLAGLWSKLLLCCLATSLVVSPSDEPRPSEGALVRAAPPVAGEFAASIVAAPQPPAPARPLAPRQDAPPRAAPAPVPSAPARRAKSIAADLRELTKLKTLAHHHPEQALRYLQQHPGSPNSILSEEREILAIEALAKVGDTAGARVQAQSFLARHPQSAYAARARQLLGASAP